MDFCIWPEKNCIKFTHARKTSTKKKNRKQFSLSKTKRSKKTAVFNAVRMLIYTHSLSSIVIVAILYVSSTNRFAFRCKVNGFLSPFEIEHSIVWWLIITHIIPLHWHIATVSLFHFVSLTKAKEKKLIFFIQKFDINRASNEINVRCYISQCGENSNV